MNHYTENSIKSDDISRCNLVLSDFGYYISYDGGTDIYPTLKIYQKKLTNISYDLILMDNFDFEMDFFVEGEKRLNFILDNLNFSEITNVFFFQKNLPSLEKCRIDPNLVKTDVDYMSGKINISGKMSDIIGYLTIFLRTYDLSEKVWGVDEFGIEKFLPKFKIGDLVSPKNERTEIKVVGYSLGKKGEDCELLYNCLSPDSKFPSIISLMSGDSIQPSRSSKIDQILNKS